MDDAGNRKEKDIRLRNVALEEDAPHTMGRYKDQQICPIIPRVKTRRTPMLPTKRFSVTLVLFRLLVHTLYCNYLFAYYLEL